MRSMSARRERGARPGHVLVDGRAAQLDAAVVEVEHPALHGHRAQPDAAPLHLHDPLAVAEREPGAVELRGIRRPELRRRHRHRELDALAAGASLGQDEALARPAPARRAQAPPRASARRCHGRCARAGRRAAGWPGSRSRGRGRRPRRACRAPRDAPDPAGTSRTGRTIPFQFHQASGSFGFLRPSTITTSSLRAPGAQATRLEAEGRVGIGVATEPPPVQVDGRRSPHALELEEPAEAARRVRTRERDPVAAHLAREERGQGARVEDARHAGRAPLAGRLSGAAGRGRSRVRQHAGRRGLLGWGRLRRGGVRGLDAHLPAARKAALARGRVGRPPRRARRRAAAGMTGPAGAASAPTVAGCECLVLPTLRRAVGRGCRVPGGAAGRIRRPADARRARLRAGATELPLAHCGLRDRRIRARQGRARDPGSRSNVRLRPGAGRRRAGADPVQGRARGRAGDAPGGLAPAAAQAGRSRCRSPAGSSRSRPTADRPGLDRVLPRRRAAVADRPGAVVGRGHEPARAAAGPPLAQPRVGPQRRPGAARRARLHGRRGGRPRLRLVGVRDPGRGRRRC